MYLCWRNCVILIARVIPAACALVQETHQEMRYRNVTSLYFATTLAFNAPTEGFPWDDLRKVLHGGQGIVKVQNGEEIAYCRKFQPPE